MAITPTDIANYLSLIILALAVIRPAQHAWRFFVENGFVRAISIMFLGESFNMLMTLTFATLATLDLLDKTPPIVEAAMRIVMATVAVLTSENLTRQEKKRQSNLMKLKPKQ
ncbi:MAG: hypothetical protein ACPGXY_03130 [Alphaproteobacteria bacterium]